MKFDFIAEQQALYPVIVLCKVMKVSRSGFYSYLKRFERNLIEREKQNRVLIDAIKAAHEENKRRYGSPLMPS